jgi:hypothetical protein
VVPASQPDRGGNQASRCPGNPCRRPSPARLGQPEDKSDPTGGTALNNGSFLAPPQLDFGGLEGFLGLPHGADRGGFEDAGDEPVALVVAAQELALVLALPDQEQQVAVGGLHVEDGDLGLGPRLHDDLDELALAVGLHVQGDGARRAAAAGRSVSDLQPCALWANLMSSRFVSMEGETRSRQVGFAGGQGEGSRSGPGRPPAR